MRAPLSLAVAQPECTRLDVAANALAHAGAVRSAAAQVVVFPEMSLTGYELDAPLVDVADERLAPLVEACAATRAVALVGAPVAGDGGRPHIATLAVDGHGARVVYRKMWLGGDELLRFAPGGSPAVVEVHGWRLGLAICKDTGIARHAANTAALGIDVYVAGIVHDADEPDEHDRRALAVAAAHGVWVATASFAGPTGGGYDSTAGRSTIWSPDGTCVAAADAAPGSIASAVVGAPRTG